jgi:hypothetical protein
MILVGLKSLIYRQSESIYAILIRKIIHPIYIYYVNDPEIINFLQTDSLTKLVGPNELFYPNCLKE